MEKRLIEWIILIGALLILILGVIFFIFYFNNQEEICQTNPFVYGAKQYVKQDHIGAVHGRVMLGTFPSSEIWFNENNMTFLSQKYKNGMGGEPPILNKSIFDLVS
tara:strand:+ start:185 stop:502 length:318 start_codon:yes stop_codon:yes gene_type:complete